MSDFVAIPVLLGDLKEIETGTHVRSFGRLVSIQMKENTLLFEHNQVLHSVDITLLDVIPSKIGGLWEFVGEYLDEIVKVRFMNEILEGHLKYCEELYELKRNMITNK